MTSSGIETTTFWLAVQCLNQLRCNVLVSYNVLVCTCMAVKVHTVMYCAPAP
jgi:hypothetical protein